MILKINRKAARIILLFTAAFALLPLPAAQADTAKLTVHQKFVVTGQAPAQLDKKVDYVLSRNGDDVPMPSGTAGGRYRFAITGNGEKVFVLNTEAAEAPDTLTFRHAGIYRYRLQALNANEGKRSSKVTAYDVEIGVVNSAGGLAVKEMIISDTKSGMKSASPEFLVNVQGDPAKNPKTGDLHNILPFSVLLLSAAGLLALMGKKKLR